jgi:hypothetical protein
MTRRLILLLAIMLGAFVWGAEMRAQCACPDGVGDVTQNIVICLGGANHTVEVTYCNTIMVPPQFWYCATDLLDMFTSIKKVCYPPTGFTDAQILDAIYCAMNPANGNYFNIQASHFSWVQDPSGPSLLFCWVLAKPRCTMRDTNNCIVPCAPYCCNIWRQYGIDGAGNIIYHPYEDTEDCPGSGGCPWFQDQCKAAACTRPTCDCP